MGWSWNLVIVKNKEGEIIARKWTHKWTHKWAHNAKRDKICREVIEWKNWAAFDFEDIPHLLKHFLSILVTTGDNITIVIPLNLYFRSEERTFFFSCLLTTSQ